MKSVLIAMVLSSGLVAFAANTWHVDDDWLDRDGDGSAEKPYGMIQQAVNAASSCDTILVAPGTYDRTPTEANGCIVKIPNTKTNLTIRATGGRDVTFIVGHPGPADDPCGTGAMGGVQAHNKGRTIVDGFTVSNCYRTSNSSGHGTAFLGNADVRDALHIYNCRVAKCVGGAVCGARIHSTIIDGCILFRTDDQYGCVGGRRYDADNCLFTRNVGGGLAVNAKLVNCTLAQNTAHLNKDGLEAFHNSIVSLSMNCASAYKGPSTNSVSSGTFNMVKADNVTNNVPATAIFAGLESFADYRLRSDSPAVGRGDPALLAAYVPLVPADRDPPDEPGRYSAYHDLNGNLIDRAAEHVHAGALQETVEVDDSALALTDFKQAYDETLLIDGEEFVGAEAFIRTASSCPTQWFVTAASPATHPLSAVDDSLANLSRLSGSNGVIWVTSAPLGATRNISVETAQSLYYMDPDGNDAWDGLSPTNVPGTLTGPWQTFTNAAQRLYDQETSGRRVMVRCAPGRYDKGSKNFARARFYYRSAWTNSKFHFFGTEGAERTFLVGAEATDKDEHGCGTDAVGCVYNYGITSLGFTGFTFTGGRTPNGTITESGAALVCTLVQTEGDGAKGAQTVFCESIVTDNVSTDKQVGWRQGRLTRPIVFDRCRLFGNVAYGSNLFDAAIFLGCVIRDENFKQYAVYARNVSVAVNTTFVRGTGWPSKNCYLLYTKSGGHAYNSIFTDFKDENYITLEDVVGCVYDNSVISSYTDATRNTKTGAAMYVNKAVHDYRLLSCSAANGAARLDGPEYVTYAATDFEGVPVCRGTAPTVAGAFTVTVPKGVGIEDPDGLILANGEEASGGHILPEGASLVLSANTSVQTTRPISGVTLNGVTNLFAGADGTVTITSDDLADGGILVKPIVGNAWYVNAGDDPGWAAGDDDANLGWGTWTPFRTLMKAMGKAQAGDVVIAAPGRYTDGNGSYTATVSGQNLTVLVRVDVKDGVTLRSEQGAEKTFIVGADATTPDTDEFGCGSNAVSCVLLTRASRLEGFTLTGGRSRSESFVSGSAVRANANAVCADCIISNCAAVNTIVYWGSFRRCRILANRTKVARTLSSTSLANVLIDGNRFGDDYYGFCWNQNGWTNVTWGADNLLHDGTASTYGVTPHALVAANCLILGSVANKNVSVTMTNCLVTAGTFRNVDDPAAIRLDAEGRPLVVDGNLALDGGTLDGYDAAIFGDADASGRPRVMNAKIDIGALEGDWRPRFGKDIGVRVTVTEASSAIEETDRRTVSFGAGGTVAFGWECPAVPCELRFNVTGNGTLTVSREGDVAKTYTEGDGQTYAFTPETAGVQCFTVTYEPGEGDTGSAEIVRARRDIGMMMLIR